MSKPEVLNVLNISTAHLKPETIKFLDSLPLEQYPFAGGPIPYGYITYAHDDQSDDMPDDVWAACKLATSLGCTYVKFDCDVEPLTDLLPTYDHSTPDPTLPRFYVEENGAGGWVTIDRTTGKDIARAVRVRRFCDLAVQRLSNYSGGQQGEDWFQFYGVEK